MADKLKVKRWLRNGEVDPNCTTQDEIIASCGNLLDHACSHDILGEVLFEATDGKVYVVTVEAVIAEANPTYVRDVLKEIEEEEDDG